MKMRLISITVLSFGIAYVAFAGSVDKHITDPDRQAIMRLDADKRCSKHLEFGEEIACIQHVQNTIRELVPNFSCPENGSIIEPNEFIRRGVGCCYDRARFAEKALSYFGFETRHVAIYDGSYGPLSLLIPGIDSHATTEVKTSRGWMGVDSNYPFLLITKNGEVLTYESYKLRRADLAYSIEPSGFYNKNFIVIYGLLSRHGKFHGKHLPAPEFTSQELFYNFQWLGNKKSG